MVSSKVLLVLFAVFAVAAYSVGPLTKKTICHRDDSLAVECADTPVEPVCGIYRKNGKAEQISIKNPCIACYGTSYPIELYFPGLCSGDEGIYCKSDFGGSLQGRIYPVCGATKKNCKASSCQTTYSEPRIACSDSSVVYFNAGVCSGDQGISCEPYRSATATTGVNQPGFIYPSVCGYTKKGCDNYKCKKTYNDQNEACANASVKFFTDGAC